MPSAYVNPVSNGDMAESEAICEAATRPTMRFVPLKTVEQQAVLICIVLESSCFCNARC